MEYAFNISSKKDSKISFQLPLASGQLTLREAKGPPIVVYSKTDGEPFILKRGETIDIASIYYQDIAIFNLTGEKGVFKNIVDFAYEENIYTLTIFSFVTDLLLDCDADRDGKIGFNEEGKANWTWGKDGKGAIVLVDNDQDDHKSTEKFLDEREPFIVRSLGINKLPNNFSLRLSTIADCAMRISVMRKTNSNLSKVIGRLPKEQVHDLVTSSDSINHEGETLYLAAHEYPGPFFEGLIIIKLELIHHFNDREVTIATDRIMMRVAPWIMTPNTQPAKKFYTCEINDSNTNNEEFLKGLRAAASKESIDLEVIPKTIHRGDRWIQDEIEIGYSENHRGSIPVVFDSPRDRGLDNFPEVGLLGPDFGHFVVGGGVPNSLDSFGNLEVSPPVIVDGKVYPMGRIILGGRRRGQFSHNARQMMAEIRQFLYAQKVQYPFEVFTDWLAVAHVDEIVSFVPDDKSSKGFRTLLASPASVKSILQKLSHDGHDKVKLFENKLRLDTGSSAELSVGDLLNNKDFWDGNDVYQGYLNETRDTLKLELGLDDDHIVDIPVCFKVKRNEDKSLMRTLAFFPDMVNHLVHNDLSIVPKPYGPIIDGKCAFEDAFEKSLPNRRVTFIDDWYSYHEVSGEVHCGTNALRETFKASKWWNVTPEGGFDIKTIGVHDTE